MYVHIFPHSFTYITDYRSDWWRQAIGGMTAESRSAAICLLRHGKLLSFLCSTRASSGSYRGQVSCAASRILTTRGRISLGVCASIVGATVTAMPSRPRDERVSWVWSRRIYRLCAACPCRCISRHGTVGTGGRLQIYNGPTNSVAVVHAHMVEASQQRNCLL